MSTHSVSRPSVPLVSPRRAQIKQTPGARILKALRSVVDMLLLWQERSQQRWQLATMDDRALRDIGLSRHDTMRETAKWFWEP